MNRLFVLIMFFPLLLAAQENPIKVFISVDMEGIGGIGTGKMVSESGKDYALGRQLMTDEVNAVVKAIYSLGPAEIVVNDSHGDMQNLLHTKLDTRVAYIQSNIKPLGMVQGLDATFDAVIFLGYHARAGTEDGFLAHTGSGSVKGLWINGVEVGEGGLNAYFAGSLNVPVVLYSGDETFVRQYNDLDRGKYFVITKTAIGSSAAKLIHPELVKKDLESKTIQALENVDALSFLKVTEPVLVKMKFSQTTHADVVLGIPGVKRLDGTTVEFQTKSMDEAYRLIRIMYKYIRW